MDNRDIVQEWTRETVGPEETRVLAEALGRLLQPGDVVALVGELGSGKTVFSQGLARGLQVPKAYWITSPTFTIVNEYPGRIPFFHMDLYRIEKNAGILDLGLEEILYGEGAVAIEWAERLGDELPGERLEVHLAFKDEEIRRLTFKAFGASFETRLGALIDALRG